MHENQKEHCEHCQVSDETIQKLKNNAASNKKSEYELKKESAEKERSSKLRWQKNKKIVYFVSAIVLLAGLAYVGTKYIPFNNSQSGPKITVFYSSTCGCCKEYITYLRAKGFQVEAKESSNQISIKEKYGISSDIEGCHTSVVEGYFVEGMVPAEAISKLLAEKPDIRGIALPGMPENAPGMPGFNIKGLKVYQISKEGASSEFISF